MRKVIDLQMEFWKTDIADIEFDLQSRDEIPKLLIGLQYVHCTAPIREIKIEGSHLKYSLLVPLSQFDSLPQI